MPKWAHIFRNIGAGRFVETSGELGAALTERYVMRGSSFGDIDLDGDLDIALVNNGHRFALLRNGGGVGNWL